MYQPTVFPNGLRLVVCPMPHVRSATVCFFVGVGSRYDPASRAGLAHYLEHMVFKGTAAYPTARSISEAIEGIGGVLDASTSAEVTAYWAKVPVQYFQRATTLLSDMLLHPLLDPDQVEKERYVITEELHMIEDSPVDLVFSLLAETMWEGHPLGRDVAGTEEGVGAIQREDLQAYLREHYIPSRIVAVVAGAPSPQEVEEAISSALGSLAPGNFRPAVPALEDAAVPRLRLAYRDIGQINLCMAFPARSYHHPDRYILLLLDTILGGGMSSRLFQSIREDRALAYNTFSSLRQYADTGAAVIYAGIQPSRIEECLEAMWAELQLLVEEEVAQEELARAKEYNKGRLLLRLEDSYGVASWHGTQEILLEYIREVDEVIAQIEAVQPADLRRLAGELFQREQMRLVVVGPLQDEALLRRATGLDG